MNLIANTQQDMDFNVKSVQDEAFRKIIEEEKAYSVDYEKLEDHYYFKFSKKFEQASNGNEADATFSSRT